MKKYSTIHPLYMSFFSGPLYRDVGNNWRGTAFLYLFLLLAVSWIPVMFKLQARLNDFVVAEAPKFIEQVPAIRITKGEVTADAAMPYFIKDPATGEPLIVIDTTGQINSLEGTRAKALLTKSKLIMQKSAIETRTFDLSQVNDLVIDQSRIYGWLDIFMEWITIILYPFVLFFSYLYRICQVLLYAAIGKIFAAVLKTDLKYQALCSLSMVSLTPVIIINTVYNYMDLKIPFWWLICFLIAMGYLYFAVKANAGTPGPEK